MDGTPNPSKAKKKNLPVLDQPSCAFLTARDRKFVTLFGGDNDGRAVSSLVIIDVDHYLWWEVNSAIMPRINAASVGIGNRLYIFGGYEVPLATVTLQSYSIIEYDANGDWVWVVQDRPYPANLPAISGIDAAAVSLYGGKKILLTPGRETQKGVSAPLKFIFIQLLNFISRYISLGTTWSSFTHRTRHSIPSRKLSEIFLETFGGTNYMSLMVRVCFQPKLAARENGVRSMTNWLSSSLHGFLTEKLI
jgi:hypothetical protein